EDDAVGNSPRVRRELTEGVESLPGWRNGVYRKKTKTHRKIIGIAEKLVRSWEGFQVDLLVMIIIVVSIVEGIRKLVGNTLGDFQKKTGRFIVRMSEATGLAGVNHRRATVGPPVPWKQDDC
ncbi:hypothetical protein B296_00027669, partial [Ensete ventricosum]